MTHLIKSAALLLLLTLCIAGCKKNPPVTPTATGTSRVKTESTTSATGIAYVATYSYDSSGRQVQAQTDTVVTTYTYATDTITKLITLAGQRFITGYTTNSWGGVISDSRSYQYSYDANHYLTTLSYTGTGGYDSTTYTIVSGNVSSATEHQGDASTDNVLTTTYTYLGTIDTRDYGTSAWGKANTNLLSSKSITQLINGSTISTSYSYTYTYDAQARVTTQVQTSGSASYTTTYTYY